MIVYRVQHIDSEYGPYYQTINDELDSKLRLHNTSSEWPSWYEDTPYKQFRNTIGSHHRAGFQYLSQVRIWFKDAINELINEGFKIHVYQVSDKDVIFTKSSKQIIFDIENATLLTSFSI
jgi:hypothetical protein